MAEGEQNTNWQDSDGVLESILAELEQVKKERDEARDFLRTQTMMREAERDRLAEALRSVIGDYLESEGKPRTGPGADEMFRAALASMEGGEALRESTKEPPCPGCGMTAQVAPSRKEPGRWMCHGCARVFDVASMEGDK